MSLNTPAGQNLPPKWASRPALSLSRQSFRSCVQWASRYRNWNKAAQSTKDKSSPVKKAVPPVAVCLFLCPPRKHLPSKQFYDQLPVERQHVLRSRIDSSQALLHEAGLLTPLHDVAESQHPLTDDTLEPSNRAYYALRMPCPFLEDEHCTIYEERPAACRELLVTSAAELCRGSDQSRHPSRSRLRSDQHHIGPPLGRIDRHRRASHSASRRSRLGRAPSRRSPADLARKRIVRQGSRQSMAVSEPGTASAPERR